MTSEPPVDGPLTTAPDGPKPAPREAGEAGDVRRLHPAVTAINAIHHARSAFFAIVAMIASQGLAVGGGIVAAVLALATGYAFAHWRTTTYTVVDHTLHLRTGILNRTEQTIPASRISAVDTTRGLLQRTFGVVAVQIQTAGGKKKAELTLRAVSLREAERLRRELGHRAAARPEAAAAVTEVGADRGAAAPVPATFVNPGVVDPGAPVVFSLSPRALLVGALTSPSIAVVGASTAAAYSALSDALPRSVRRQLSGAVDHLTVGTALELAAIGVVLAAIVSVIGTILLYARFEITRDDRRLRVRRGLITEHVGTVPLDRVHGLRIVESPVRQLLGYASIEVEVAGYANENEATRTLVPFARRAAVPALVERLVPGYAWPTEPLHRVPPRARRRYLTIPLLISVVPAVGVAVSPIGIGRVAAVVFPLLAVLIGRLRARDAGWLVDGDLLVLRRRRFARSTLLARASRLQMVSARQSPWQRRADLASVIVRLSNKRSGSVRHIEGTVADDLLGVIRPAPARPDGAGPAAA